MPLWDCSKESSSHRAGKRSRHVREMKWTQYDEGVRNLKAVEDRSLLFDMGPSRKTPTRKMKDKGISLCVKFVTNVRDASTTRSTLASRPKSAQSRKGRVSDGPITKRP